MISSLKRLVKRSPIGGLWNKLLAQKQQRYLNSISSTKPVYPLYCTACGLYFKTFSPVSPYWEKKFIETGSDLRMKDFETMNVENYACPICHLNDRDRLYTLYLKQRLQPHISYNLIEFAPTDPLANALRFFPNINRRTADLFMDNVDDKVDLMDMRRYQNNRFDIFICSHILEHVTDDVRAMRELYRILKPGGFGIAMVPLVPSVRQTIEDTATTDEDLRWKLFGQGDHVRLYRKEDYISRLQSVGFKVLQLDKNYFGEAFFRLNGITQSSVLYVVEKEERL